MGHKAYIIGIIISFFMMLYSGLPWYYIILCLILFSGGYWYRVWVEWSDKKMKL